MLDWVMQASAYLASQGFTPHEQLLIGFIAGAMLVNPIAFAVVKGTGFVARLIDAPFKARARRIAEQQRKDRQIARLERKVKKLQDSVLVYGDPTLYKTTELEDDEDLPIMLDNLSKKESFFDPDREEGVWDPLAPDEDVSMPGMTVGATTFRACGIKA